MWWGTEPASQTVLIYCDWDLQESLEGSTSAACPAWAGLSEAAGLRSGLTAEQCVCECVEGWAGGVNLPELGQMLLTSSSQVGSLRGKMASNPPGVRAFGVDPLRAIPSPLHHPLEPPLHSLTPLTHSLTALATDTRKFTFDRVVFCLYHSSGVNTSPKCQLPASSRQVCSMMQIGP